MDWIKSGLDLIQEGIQAFFKGLQGNALLLVKIHAARHYVRGVQALRRQMLGFCLAILASIALGTSIVVVPTAIILLLPWSWPVRMALLGIWGVTAVAIPAAYVIHFFSQARWMKVTKAEDILDDVLRHR